MNAILADRVKRVFARLDERTEQVRALHAAQSRRTTRNDGETAGEALVAFRACQLCVVLDTMLDGVRVLLFKSSKLPDRSALMAARAKGAPGEGSVDLPYDGPSDVDGKANTEYKLEWFSERLDGMGPAVGIGCNTVGVAIIDAAETYLQQVADMYEIALRASREVG